MLLRFYQRAHWSAPSLQNSLSLVGISGDTIRLKKYWYQTEKFLLNVNTRDRATVKMMANFLSIQCSGILQVLWVTQDMTNIMRNMPGVCRKHNWRECISGSGLFRFLWCINNREGKAKWKFRPMQALREVFQRAVFTLSTEASEEPSYPQENVQWAFKGTHISSHQASLLFPLLGGKPQPTPHCPFNLLCA